ncbi:hypothetical protein [Pedobacter nutrimenti]|jgi:hypothetical protein|uniref:Quinol monooxygenase YgiN n=1 Tax=Pedobacter nutrimenti TaxID=1241337 RepID=A0A318UHH2_9SPHI|nr:hypothetical protein [Pedobacter nutrimenti]PYF74990.1 hypothetical protein B0O44_103436 [Pedobacter nutrimenti]
MISVKVTYTVKEEFSLENQQNIKTFLEDFRQMNPEDFRYSIYRLGDKKTFVHISQYKNEFIQQKILQTGSFLYFQKKRDESGLEAAPQIEVMELIGASADF